MTLDLAPGRWRSWTEDYSSIQQQSRIDCFAVDLNGFSGLLINREIDGDYGGLPTHYEIGFIGQPDLLSAWRSEGGGYDFTRKTFVLGAHAHHRNQPHLEYVLPHDYGRTPIPSTAKLLEIC